MIQKIKNRLFPAIEKLYFERDKKDIRRAKNIGLIPMSAGRRGGKRSYAEWAYVSGILQTIFYQNLENKENNQILDIGCGTGLLSIAADPFIQGGGAYTGIDVMIKDIEFNKNHYPKETHQFIHHDVANRMYAEEQKGQQLPWKISSDYYDLMTALSVWTHLTEKDAKYYLTEVDRVLKPAAKAVISFFYLDDIYEQSSERRNKDISAFHNSSPKEWTFDQNAYESKEWKTPKWTSIPEIAIGVTPKGLESAIADLSLELVNYYPGSWKEQAGIFFQDILIFEKQR